MELRFIKRTLYRKTVDKSKERVETKGTCTLQFREAVSTGWRWVDVPEVNEDDVE